MSTQVKVESTRLYEKYEPVIGLEVHCQLSTQTKAFSPEPVSYGADPNTHVDPISLGHPGTLPVLNEEVVWQTLRLGLAMNCEIASRAHFARKHYFYPDLPKGYQLTQYDTPLCYDGHLELTLGGDDDGGASTLRTRQVGITRVHIEEDAGKSLHEQHEEATLVDYNRCGVPLVEIVTEPDLRTPREASACLRKIRQLVRYLGISDGNMEEGSLRCDANVSVRSRGSYDEPPKTEIKNLNSFRHVAQALDYEIARQIRQHEQGEAVASETRRWDASSQETRFLRRKEEAPDYRYMADPDLGTVEITGEMMTEARASLPEMPGQRRQRYIAEMGLPAYDAGVLSEEPGVADFFEETVAKLAKVQGGGNWKAQAKASSNFVRTTVLRTLNEREIDIEELPVTPHRLAELLHLRLEEEVSSNGAEQLFEAMLETEKAPAQLADERNLRQVSDRDALRPVVEDVLSRHPDKVDAYLDGKEGLLGFFIGQVRRAFQGAPDPHAVRQLIQEKLDAGHTR